MCDFGEQTGWYAQYYNYLATHPDMNLDQAQWPDATHGDPESDVTPWNTDWYDNEYLCMTDVDSNLAFGDNFFPLDDTICEVETTNGHEYHFGVKWTAQVEITTEDTYDFSLRSDDDGWVYIDGVLVAENDGIHPATTVNFSKLLTVGTHTFEIYFAERHTVGSYMSFTSLDELTFIPYNEACTICGDEKVSGNEQCDDGNDVSGDGCEPRTCMISVCNVEQNLVYNGGFEEPALGAGTWSIIPNVAGGWTVEIAGTDTPDGLEIQNSLWTPFQGVQYAELDGNLSTEISQTLTTIPGQWYTLDFALSARPSTAAGTNGIEVYRNGNLVDPFILDGSANGDTSWNTYSYNVLATSSSSTLLIKDVGTSDSLGTFVDDVSVMCAYREPSCGNGEMDEGEQCDDGNTEDGDGCSANCTEEYTEPYCGDQIVNGEEECDGGEMCDDCECPEGYESDSEGGCEEMTDECEIPYEDSDEMAEAEEFCSQYQELYKIDALVVQEVDSILLNDYQQCIYDYFCEEECTETTNFQYEVFAQDDSLTATPLITAISIEAGDYVTITVDPTDTWSAGPADRTSNANGLTDTNIYGGNYGNYATLDGSFPYGALVGRTFGGTYFLIGTSFAGEMSEAGVLELLYWDSNSEDNDGSVLVSINVESDVACDESYCGDGTVDEGEECDDGNDDNGDDCSNDCTENDGGGGRTSTIPGDGDGDGDGDTPDELLRTGGDGDGDTDRDEPRTSTPLVFSQESPVAFQLPVMLAATGATAQSKTLWIVVFIVSVLGIAGLISSQILSKQK